MIRVCLTAVACSLALMTAACGTDATENGQNEVAVNDMNTMMADAGPFANVEMRMNDAMMAAVGVDAGDSWVRKMIEHHKGAVDMSRLVLTMNPSAHVAQMANGIIEKQTKEIAALQKLVAQGTPAAASAEIYRPAMGQMHNAMMAVSGADLSETFHRKMLEHHKGAIALSDAALANGVSGAIRTQVEKTRADQQREVETIEAMLSGEPAPAASEPAASNPVSKPAAPKAPAKTAPPKKAPEPEHDPHAGHDMNNMQ